MQKLKSKNVILIVESMETGNFHRAFFNGMVEACKELDPTITVTPIICPRETDLNEHDYHKLITNIVDRYGCYVFFAIRGDQLGYKTLEYFFKQYIRTITWQIDDPFMLTHSSGIKMKSLFPGFYKIFTTDKYSLENIYPTIKTCKNKVFHLPFGYDSNTHKNLKLEKIYDVTFVGTGFSGRMNKYLNSLQEDLDKENIKLHLFGINNRVSFGEMVKITNQSKIILNFADQPDGKLCLKNRVMETLGMGQFLLTEDFPNLKDYFKPKTHLETFENYSELLEKIKYYLNNDKKREKIAKSGERAVKKYSYKKLLLPIMKVELDIIK